MKLGDISVSYVGIFCKAMEALGADSGAILRQFGLNRVTLASPDARISIPRYMRLGYAGMMLVRAPWIGLEMGRVTQVSDLGTAGLLAMTSQDVRRACQNMTHYSLLGSYNVRGQSEFSVEEDNGVVSFYSISPYNDYNLFVVDSVLCGWSNMLRWLTGRDDCVQQVQFEFEMPSYAEKYAEYFSCDVRFGQERNALVIRGDVLDQPVLYASAPTYEMLKRQADAALEKVRLGLSFPEVVSRVITPLLSGSTPTLEQVSEQLNMAPWTVRRKLISEGSTYQEVLNETRKELAVSYIKDTSLSLGEISYLLGFASPTAFQRAFKRWTGIAPGSYRTALPAR